MATSTTFGPTTLAAILVSKQSKCKYTPTLIPSYISIYIYKHTYIHATYKYMYMYVGVHFLVFPCISIR